MTNGKKIRASYDTQKGLISPIYKELLNWGWG